MRLSSFEDCKNVLNFYNIEIANKPAIDVGGTEFVCLKKRWADSASVVKNPILDLKKDIDFLDMGFNINALKTTANEQINLLNRSTFEHLKNKFEMVFCFDTLEHVENPSLFCENLAYITKPRGFIYIASVFNWAYHPSPEDYFRFTPSGLQQCFKNTNLAENVDYTVVWSGWESMKEGVSILIYNGQREEFSTTKLFQHPDLYNYKCFSLKLVRFLKEKFIHFENMILEAKYLNRLK